MTQFIQIVLRGDGADTKTFAHSEVSNVMRDDRRHTGRHGQFQQQIILGIGQAGPSQKIDFLTSDEITEVVQDDANIRAGETEQFSVTLPNIFVFKNQWRRQHDSQPAFDQALQNMPGSASRRLERGEQHMGIHDDTLLGPPKGGNVLGRTSTKPVHA